MNGASSSDFGKDHGLIHEAVVTGREVGAGKEFWAALAHSKEVFRETLAFVMNFPPLVFQLTATFDHDKRQDDWKLKADTTAKEGEFRPELAEILREGESHVPGETMLERAEDFGLGQHHAEAMLRHQPAIPKEWRKYTLVFTGTVWRDPGGHRDVPFLCWSGKEWRLNFSQLRSSFASHCRLVRARKSV